MVVLIDNYDSFVYNLYQYIGTIDDEIKVFRNDEISVEEIEKLKEIIADVLNVEVNDITEDTTFVDDLGADSLDIFQIIMGIEETFDIEIDNDDAEQISTVGDAVEQIKNATNNN